MEEGEVVEVLVGGSVGIGLGVVLVLAFYFLRDWRETRRRNRERDDIQRGLMIMELDAANGGPDRYGLRTMKQYFPSNGMYAPAYIVKAEYVGAADRRGEDLAQFRVDLRGHRSISPETGHDS